MSANETPKESGWVLKNIRSVARSKVAAGCIIVFAGFLGLFFSRHTIYNYLCGPFDIRLSEYRSAMDEGFLHKYYVTVTGDSLIRTTIGEYALPKHSKHTSDIAPAHQGSRSAFYIFASGKAHIMAKLDNSDSQNGWIIDRPGPYTFTGVLDDLDDDDLIRLMQKYNADLYKSVDMYMLDSGEVTAKRIFMWILLVIFGLITLTGILELVKNIPRMMNPLGTKYARGLTHYGDVHTLSLEVEKEYAKGHEKWENLVYTENWVLDAESPKEEYPLGKRSDFKTVIIKREKAGKNSEVKMYYTMKFATGLEAEFNNTKTSETDIHLNMVAFKRINPGVEIRRV